MTVQEFLDAVAQIESDARRTIGTLDSIDTLGAARTALLGRRGGRITELMRHLPRLPLDARRDAGAAVNRAKETIEAELAARRATLVATAPPTEQADLTMPARPMWRGAKHPVTLVMEEIEEIFRELGFAVVLGPEAELEWYNFAALNFPADHPAMDMHDTLYLDPAGASRQSDSGHARDATHTPMLLRTHTSPVQVRTLQRHPPPVRVLIPGNVYRRDFFDASHAPMFAQVEGLAVDEGISFVDLKATLTRFAQRLFGATRTRFRPSFFPFTEPSAEMDVRCGVCGGSGCATCKETGWIEILGSGMVHPAVLDASGVDSERYTGWAFGMGPGRIALSRYGIPDIRLLYDSDMRFLEQFAP